jgi:hypothetical protein
VRGPQLGMHKIPCITHFMHYYVMHYAIVYCSMCKCKTELLHNKTKLNRSREDEEMEMGLSSGNTHDRVARLECAWAYEEWVHVVWHWGMGCSMLQEGSLCGHGVSLWSDQLEELLGDLSGCLRFHRVLVSCKLPGRGDTALGGCTCVVAGTEGQE